MKSVIVSVKTRELKQPERPRQQERHQFADLTMKNNSFAPFAGLKCHRGLKLGLLSLCRALWRILRAKMENLAG